MVARKWSELKLNSSTVKEDVMAKGRKTRKNGPGKKALTWAELVRLEPGLGPLLEEARAHHADRSAVFCANAVFYGSADSTRGLKRRLLRLVGRDSGRAGVLGTSVAYDVAYDTIFAALPDCRGECACLAVLRGLTVDAPRG
jgi:hypothetical protein